MSRQRTWLRGRLLRETEALPVDLFRVLVGLIGAAYFVNRALHVPDFGAPDGLIDHALLARALWFTRMSLFQPGMGLPAFYAALAAGFACSLGIAAGWRTKLCAAAAFIVAVSWTRWNFLVIEIDDTVFELMLFWLLLLPVGRTLTLGDRLRSGPSCWKRWKTERVPGTAVWCLMANVCLVYLVAGLWKLTFPMWRNGFALYAVLRLPMSRTRDLWCSADLPWLRAASYFALTMEISLPFLLAAPRGSWAKRLGFIFMLAFHLGIASCFGLPFVNLLLLGSAVLFFREPLMERVFGVREPARVAEAKSVGREGIFAAALLVLVAMSVCRDVPVIGRPLGGAASTVLWLAGLAQDYRLFDWVEAKNYRIDYEIFPKGSAARRAFDPAGFLPATTSAVLLQAYLYDIHWMSFPRKHLPELKASILSRAAARFCRVHPGVNVSLRAQAVIRRITAADPDLMQVVERPVIDFRCSAGEAAVDKILLE